MSPVTFVPCYIVLESLLSRHINFVLQMLLPSLAFPVSCELGQWDGNTTQTKVMSHQLTYYTDTQLQPNVILLPLNISDRAPRHSDSEFEVTRHALLHVELGQLTRVNSCYSHVIPPRIPSLPTITVNCPSDTDIVDQGYGYRLGAHPPPLKHTALRLFTLGYLRGHFHREWSPHIEFPPTNTQPPPISEGNFTCYQRPNPMALVPEVPFHSLFFSLNPPN